MRIQGIRSRKSQFLVENIHMNKFLKSMMVAALALSAARLQAGTDKVTHLHTDKTTLTTRSNGVNSAMEWSGGFAEQVMRGDKNRFGGNFQAVGFYNDSAKNDALAKYFLSANKSTINFGTGGDAPNYQLPASTGVSSLTNDDSWALAMEHSSYGVHLNYFQDLEKILKGLHFSINLPVVQVSNKVSITNKGANAIASGAYLLDTANLTNARIKNGNLQNTGIADIDLQLGYKFLDKETYSACIDLGLTIPTGNDNKGQYVFDAIYGNGQHFGLGAGLGFGARVWGDHHHNIKLHAGLQYRYLFEASEKRTLGLQDATGTVVQLGQYTMLTAAAAGTSDTIAANVTTLNVNVTPGSLLDGVVSLAYNNGGFLVDAGYNLYFREVETLKLKDKWDETKYTSTFNTATTASAVKTENLSTGSATTPSQTTHKVFGNLGYMFRDWETPVHVAAGAHYEFVSSNSAIEGWGVNARLGISF